MIMIRSPAEWARRALTVPSVVAEPIVAPAGAVKPITSEVSYEKSEVAAVAQARQPDDVVSEPAEAMAAPAELDATESELATETEPANVAEPEPEALAPRSAFEVVAPVAAAVFHSVTRWKASTEPRPVARS